MGKNILLIIHFLFSFLFSFSQNQISGVVINASDNSKMPSASVFINNSSKGTLTNSDGSFTITGITQTNFELVISYAGFETVSLKITPENIRSFHTIKLFPKKVELEEISLESPVKNGWEKYGKLFTENFIGTSQFALQCKIENPEVLRFFINKKTNVVRAISLGNILIENRALGYKVRYQLEQFTFDPKNRYVAYFGYTSFEDLNKNTRRKFEKNRRQSFDGSLMHFFRALYTNTIAAQGFQVRERIRIANTDSAFTQIYRNGLVAKTVSFDTGKSSPKYITLPGLKINGVPAYIDLVDPVPFDFNKAINIDPVSQQKTFYFPNHLQVAYGGKKLSAELSDVFSKSNSSIQFSDIILVREEPLIIYADGLYFDPTNLLTEGYWSTCKMAETLPSDYEEK